MADDSKRVDALEIVSAVVISIAGLGASWASYQAGLWDGEQAAHYSQANALRVQASRVALEGDALWAVETHMFAGWLDAKARGDEQLASFYQARFPEGMKPAFNAWLADRPLQNPSAAPTPFAIASYQRPGQGAARALDTQADKTFAKGQHDNAVSDAFEQGATILALGLFFGGIGQVFKLRTSRIVLLSIAGVAVVAGFLRLFSLPLQLLGLGAPG
jgi:hypothetical protein